MLAATTVSLAVFTQAATETPADNSGVIGRVGDSEVRAEDIRSTLEKLGAGQQAAISRDPSLLNQVVRSLLVQRLVLKEAQDRKWDQQASVAEAINRAKDTAIIESFLQSVSKPPDSYPDEADLAAAYESAKPSLLVPRTFRLAQIYIASAKGAPKETSDKAVSRIDNVRKLLKQKGADFSALARAHSEEKDSAARGGEIGWLADTQIQPEIRAQLPALTVNAVSEPIRLDDGWHIIRVLDVREPYTQTLEQVRSQLVQKLRTDRTRANTEAYLARLLRENPVAINELALSKMLPQPQK